MVMSTAVLWIIILFSFITYLVLNFSVTVFSSHTKVQPIS